MEIERKWLVKKLPDLSKVTPSKQERYFLFISPTVEIRIQKVDEIYFFERKEVTGKFSRTEQKLTITKEEFEHLKKLSTSKALLRENYVIQNDPEISIKIYHGKFEGLRRVEVEFKSETEAHAFEPLDWFGKEITESEIGSDKTLISLDKQKLLTALAN